VGAVFSRFLRSSLPTNGRQRCSSQWPVLPSLESSFPSLPAQPQSAIRKPGPALSVCSVPLRLSPRFHPHSRAVSGPVQVGVPRFLGGAAISPAPRRPRRSADTSPNQNLRTKAPLIILSRSGAPWVTSPIGLLCRRLGRLIAVAQRLVYLPGQQPMQQPPVSVPPPRWLASWRSFLHAPPASIPSASDRCPAQTVLPSFQRSGFLAFCC
jgi:hypothetical protein